MAVALFHHPGRNFIDWPARKRFAHERRCPETGTHATRSRVAKLPAHPVPAGFREIGDMTAPALRPRPRFRGEVAD
ncbi:unnamed protein product [Amoebophrya sp. A120]|nr:unnamed protein product [Amoebophrya sp. A120]|eukprot:GSA120T00024523001.1